MRLKVRDERWAEARERSRAEQSEKSRVQQYANEPNEENMRETPYIGREARQMSEWEMLGWTASYNINILHGYTFVYVNHLKFSYPLTFSANILWVPAHNFVCARAPGPGIPHPMIVCISCQLNNNFANFKWMLPNDYNGR